MIDTKPGHMNRLTFESLNLEACLPGGRNFFHKFGSSQSRVPLKPEIFDSLLEERRREASANGYDLFTSGKDVKIVPKLYREVFAGLMHGKFISYSRAQLA